MKYLDFIAEAQKRIKMINFSRGTTKSRTDQSNKTGKMSSTDFGTLGPGHYVTHDEKKARKYAEINAKQRKDNPSVVRYKVPKQSVHDVSGIPKGTTKKNPETPKGTKVIRNKVSGHSVILNPDDAKKYRTNTPTIRRKKK